MTINSNDLQKQRVINNLKRKDAVAHFSAALSYEMKVIDGVAYKKPIVKFQANGHSSDLDILLFAMNDYLQKAIKESNVES